jgi:histidine ammonia-lyase
MSEVLDELGPTGLVFTVGDQPLTIPALVGLATGELRPALGAEARDRMKRSADLVATLHDRGEDIYGVTTSVGGSVGTSVPPSHSANLSLNVLRMHGVGSGRILDDVEAGAVVAARLSSLARGQSGVRPEVADLLIDLLDARALPRIPSEGSVGASGDLTPLSYVAAVLVGEREVSFRGEEIDARSALRAIGRAPLKLRPKEGLALMNGTSVSTALACLSWHRARRLARLAASLTAMTSVAIRGNAEHFDDRLQAAKPHPGQRRVAHWIREDMAGGTPSVETPARLQDRYSVRCAPHVIGVLEDALDWTRATLETELNGVSDNPIVDLESGNILHGGNFYGGHVGFACDALKLAVANVACLLDRQIMLLCNPAENAGLPADLVGVAEPVACAHNGFKAASIAASSLAAEALKQTMPASAFSRSTELHNQDKVPMATIAARDLTRVLELSEQVAAISLLAACQAQDLRGISVTGRIAGLRQRVRSVVPMLREDRRMDRDLAAVLELLRKDELFPGTEIGEEPLGVTRA